VIQTNAERRAAEMVSRGREGEGKKVGKVHTSAWARPLCGCECASARREDERTGMMGSSWWLCMRGLVGGWVGGRAEVGVWGGGVWGGGAGTAAYLRNSSRRRLEPAVTLCNHNEIGQFHDPPFNALQAITSLGGIEGDDE
jgi:hypothetical protein